MLNPVAVMKKPGAEAPGSAGRQRSGTPCFYMKSNNDARLWAADFESYWKG